MLYYKVISATKKPHWGSRLVLIKIFQMIILAEEVREKASSEFHIVFPMENNPFLSITCSAGGWERRR